MYYNSNTDHNTEQQSRTSFYELKHKHFSWGEDYAKKGIPQEKWSWGHKTQQQIIFCLCRFFYHRFGVGFELQRAEAVIGVVDKSIRMSEEARQKIFASILEKCNWKPQKVRKRVEPQQDESENRKKTEKARRKKTEEANERVQKGLDNFVGVHKRLPTLRELQQWGKCGEVVAKRILERNTVPSKAKSLETSKELDREFKAEAEKVKELLPPNPNRSDSAGTPVFVEKVPETDIEQRFKALRILIEKPIQRSETLVGQEKESGICQNTPIDICSKELLFRRNKDSYEGSDQRKVQNTSKDKGLPLPEWKNSLRNKSPERTNLEMLRILENFKEAMSKVSFPGNKPDNLNSSTYQRGS